MSDEGFVMSKKEKVIISLSIFAFLAFIFWGIPQYKVYKQTIRGKAALREAQWSKKIAIEEAKAKKESATLEAAAEVERAKGVARSNQIIGDSLKGNEEYLRYLWITSIDSEGERIYIPTEANLPILEARK